MYRLLTGHKSQVIVLLLLLLAGVGTLRAQADTLYGFSFAASSDRSAWRQLTQPQEITIVYPYGNPHCSIGFDFPFLDGTYSCIMFNSDGEFRFITDEYEATFGYIDNWNASPYVALAAQNGDFNGTVVLPRVLTQLFGNEGNRTLVIEGVFCMALTSDTLLRFQIHLGEYDGTIRMLVEGTQENTSVRGYLRLADHRYLGVIAGISQLTEYPSFNVIGTAFRNYLFTPVVPACPTVPHIRAEEVTLSSARICWDRNRLHNRYEVEYGPAGFAPGTGIRVITTSNSILLTNLQEGMHYTARMTAECVNGAIAQPDSCQFITYCSEPHGNQIYFANLYDSNVVCQVGRFYNPDQMAYVASFFGNDARTRHWVCHNLSETDPNTGGRLYTIPVGHCMSVRLGNAYSGAQQESVTYRLHVDTNDYDLLILRYAIVEQDPGHPPNEQPQFIFSVNDSLGQVISNCYYGNFVSGISSGWNRTSGSVTGEDVLWRNWSSVGIDLAPLHGRNIQVKLSNYDCEPGGHYGYAYYTLESGRKAFETAICGETAANTFYAPAGFSYRWYDASDSAATLSTDDSLVVTQPGTYGCWVSYNLSGQSCGFNMFTVAGPRYPAAAFTSRSLDSCGSIRQFVNHSRVATDSAHAHLTSEPCTRYLWRFGDGTTSEAVNPIHTFASGTFTVELVSMLSGGACRDSVWQTIVVNMPADSQQVSLCPGDQIEFYGCLVSDSGRYVHYADCQEHILRCSFYPTYEEERYVDICANEQYAIGDSVYTQPGRYRYAVPDQHQCDSVQWINLTVKPLSDSTMADTLALGQPRYIDGEPYYAPMVGNVVLQGANGCDSIVTLRLSCVDRRDTLVCVGDLPLRWDGMTFTRPGIDTLRRWSTCYTDSLVVRSLDIRLRPRIRPSISRTCSSPAYYTVQLPDDYTYRWSSFPPDTALQGQTGSEVRLSPARYTCYYLTSDYPDDPSCPATDTLPLEVMRFVEPGLYVQPAWLSTDQLEFRAWDQSRHTSSRQWYVNGQPQLEEGRELHYLADSKADSVVLMLRVGNGSCDDSVAQVIPIYRFTLWFPNIFTPDAETNNRFGCTATHIGDYKLWVYDRHGQLVFYTSDQQQRWDGTCRGIPCPQAAYTYRCQYSIPVAGMQSKSGTVMLVR